MNIFTDNFNLRKSHIDNMLGRFVVDNIEKGRDYKALLEKLYERRGENPDGTLKEDIEKGGFGSGKHPSYKHFSGLLSDVDKWANNTHTEEQFLSNVNADIQRRTSHEKLKLSKLDLSIKQLGQLRSKWRSIRFKGKDNS